MTRKTALEETVNADEHLSRFKQRELFSRIKKAAANMAAHPPRKKKKTLPNLDDDAIEKIYSFLPIKLTLNLGATSKRFQDSWTFSRHLHFDKSSTKKLNHEDYIKTVDRILNLHTGAKVHSFRLYTNSRLNSSILQEWFRILTSKQVQELDLDFSAGMTESMTLPSFFLDSVMQIKSLKLTYCRPHLPENVRVFQSLIKLTLHRIQLNNRFLYLITRNCVLLESLALLQCTGSDNLAVHAFGQKRFNRLMVANCRTVHNIDVYVPTLSSYHFCGDIHNVSVCIPNADLHDMVLDVQNNGPATSWKIEYFFGILRQVKILTVNSSFLQGMRPNAICMKNLIEIQLLMEATSYCNPYDVALFLSNCPVIERVFIDLNGFTFNCGSGSYWKTHDMKCLENLDYIFGHLKSVKLNGFKLQNEEMLFVKFFLEKSPVLEKMFLITPKSRSHKVCNKDIEKCLIFLSWKLSPMANVHVFQHSMDRSFLYPTQS